MTLTHNSTLAQDEPEWGSLHHDDLPDSGFADPDGRRFPHHWIHNETMYLHRGGLTAAWSAAHGARSGDQAESSVIAHLSAHRQAIGADEADTTPVRAPGRVTMATANPEPQAPSPRESVYPRSYDCVFIQAGPVMQADGEPSPWKIPDTVLAQAAPLFDSVAVYLDHPDEFGLFGERQQPKVRNLIGVTSGAHFDHHTGAITGRIRLYDQVPGPAQFVRALLDQVLADREAGRETPPVGLSAVFYQTVEQDETDGAWTTTAIRHVESVDIVYSPGARGYVRAALAAIRSNPYPLAGTPAPSAPPERNHEMSQNDRSPERENSPAPSAQPPAPSAQPLAPSAQPLAPSAPAPEIARLEAQIGDLTRTVAALTAQLTERAETEAERSTVQGMGTAPRSPIRLGRTGIEQVQAAVEAMLAGVRPPDGVQPLTGIRELYHILSGDYEMTGVFQRDRVYLANVTASTMANMVANVLNKRVMIEFQQYPQWWAPIVTIEDFASLQQVRWITLGGVGELPTVAEGAAYTELTWDDISQRDSFVKKGGYLGLTIEAIDKDDTRRLATAPRALAQAAWLTLSKSISAIFTANSGVGPNIYYDDSNQRALFHASNGNLGTSALSWSSWVTTRQLMRDQTEHNSGEPLGALTAPRYLLVPAELEMTALQILASEGVPGTGDYDTNPEADGDTLSARLRAARERVIVVDMWTDTNNWAAVADPRLYPSIGLGFRYGRTPEIFSVADPSAGLMFSNDTMPVKARFFYATGPIDWRGMYKHNVS